jgi:hypothetical protein
VPLAQLDRKVQLVYLLLVQQVPLVQLVRQVQQVPLVLLVRQV